MNKEESLALFAKGKDAWNAWAAERLAERERLKAADTWVESPSEAAWNEETLDWHEMASAEFSEHSFQDGDDFTGFVFPGRAVFDRATFGGNARFDGAKFGGNAGFDGATFEGNARFAETKFGGNAGFDEAKFGGGARFYGAEFMGGAWFSRAKFGGVVQFNGSKFGGDAEFGEATFGGRAGFGGAKFRGDVEFGEATFERSANFDRSKFKFGGNFNEAKFRGNASFNEATFTGVVRFGMATFCGITAFHNASFESYAGFGQTIFRGDTGFQQTAFKGFASFSGAEFHRAAHFGAIQGESTFLFAGTLFREVPDFEQAHFAEAPRLDFLRIEPDRFLQYHQTKLAAGSAIGNYLAARWRALKRLAIQGHDHARELDFFRGEIRAGRWAKGNFWPSVFSYPYQWLSDFGRSIFRPFAWWLASLGLFTCLYLGEQPELDKHPMSGVGWSIAQAFSFAGAQSPTLACVAGPEGQPWRSALGLSLHKGLLFLGGGGSDKLNQIYDCLYGVYTLKDTEPGDLRGRLLPMIPDGVGLLSLVQLLISAVLIFLFLLALRNHFRIR